MDARCRSSPGTSRSSTRPLRSRRWTYCRITTGGSPHTCIRRARSPLYFMPPTRRNSNYGRSHGAQMISLLAITGLRTGEACRLDRADVDLHAGLLSVRDTGGMIWSGKVFASRGALRGAQGCVTRRRGQFACPATVPAQEGRTPGITKTVCQPGGGALRVVVAGVSAPARPVFRRPFRRGAEYTGPRGGAEWERLKHGAQVVV